MSNEKNYRYYQVTGQEVTGLKARFEPIRDARIAAQEKMLTDSGAIAYQRSSGWGNKGSLIVALVFAADHDFGTEVTIKYTEWMGDKKVIIVRGKGRTAAARNFNEKLDACVREANEVLKNNPCFQDYLISHYNVKCCTLGSAVPGSRGGVSMISTYCGNDPVVPDTFLFAIPIARENDHQPDVPASFEEITYGVFWDRSNAKKPADEERK